MKIYVQGQWRVFLLWYHIFWQSSIQRGLHIQLCIITFFKWIIQICSNCYCWVCKIAFYSPNPHRCLGKLAIRKWQSNITEVCNEKENKEKATALGTKWHIGKDTMSVNEVESSKETILTKRMLLAQTASYYDVCGMLSGLLVRPKILLQKLWQLNIDWDSPLDHRNELYSMMSRSNKDLDELAA